MAETMESVKEFGLLLKLKGEGTCTHFLFRYVLSAVFWYSGNTTWV